MGSETSRVVSTLDTTNKTQTMTNTTLQEFLQSTLPGPDNLSMSDYINKLVQDINTLQPQTTTINITPSCSDIDLSCSDIDLSQAFHGNNTFTSPVKPVIYKPFDPIKWEQERLVHVAKINAEHQARLAKIVPENSLEDLVITSTDYDNYLSDAYDLSFQEIDRMYDIVSTVNGKRLVIRTSELRKGDILDPRLLTILTDIDYECYSGKPMFDELQTQINNADEDLIYEFDLVHYQHWGCGLEDRWKIIKTHTHSAHKRTKLN